MTKSKKSTIGEWHRIPEEVVNEVKQYMKANKIKVFSKALAEVWSK